MRNNMANGKLGLGKFFKIFLDKVLSLLLKLISIILREEHISIQVLKFKEENFKLNTNDNYVISKNFLFCGFLEKKYIKYETIYESEVRELNKFFDHFKKAIEAENNNIQPQFSMSYIKIKIITIFGFLKKLQRLLNFLIILIRIKEFIIFGFIWLIVDRIIYIEQKINLLNTYIKPFFYILFFGEGDKSQKNNIFFHRLIWGNLNYSIKKKNISIFILLSEKIINFKFFCFNFFFRLIFKGFFSKKETKSFLFIILYGYDHYISLNNLSIPYRVFFGTQVLNNIKIKEELEIDGEVIDILALYNITIWRTPLLYYLLHLRNDQNNLVQEKFIKLYWNRLAMLKDFSWLFLYFCTLSYIPGFIFIKIQNFIIINFINKNYKRSKESVNYKYETSLNDWDSNIYNDDYTSWDWTNRIKIRGPQFEKDPLGFLELPEKTDIAPLHLLRTRYTKGWYVRWEQDVEEFVPLDKAFNNISYRDAFAYAPFAPTYDEIVFGIGGFLLFFSQGDWEYYDEHLDEQIARYWRWHNQKGNNELLRVGFLFDRRKKIYRSLFVKVKKKNSHYYLEISEYIKIYKELKKGEELVKSKIDLLMHKGNQIDIPYWYVGKIIKIFYAELELIEKYMIYLDKQVLKKNNLGKEQQQSVLLYFSKKEEYNKKLMLKRKKITKKDLSSKTTLKD